MCNGGAAASYKRFRSLRQCFERLRRLVAPPARRKQRFTIEPEVRGEKRTAVPYTSTRVLQLMRTNNSQPSPIASTLTICVPALVTSASPANCSSQPPLAARAAQIAAQSIETEALTYIAVVRGVEKLLQTARLA